MQYSSGAQTSPAHISRIPMHLRRHQNHVSRACCGPIIDVI
jgi:hypothetical protein